MRVVTVTLVVLVTELKSQLLVLRFRLKMEFHKGRFALHYDDLQDIQIKMRRVLVLVRLYTILQS